MTSQTAAEIAASWKSGLSGATTKMQAGINGVTTAPGQSAARQKEVWAQNVASAKDKWASRVAAVPVQDWKDAMINKGLPRIATGAAAAQGKMEAFMGQLLPYEQNMVNSLPPRGDKEQNIQRAVAAMRKMGDFKLR